MLYHHFTEVIFEVEVTGFRHQIDKKCVYVFFFGGGGCGISGRLWLRRI